MPLPVYINEKLNIPFSGLAFRVAVQQNKALEDDTAPRSKNGTAPMHLQKY